MLFMQLTLNAQKKRPLNMPQYDNEPFHYGFIVGYNQMLFSLDYKNNFQNEIHGANSLPSNSVQVNEGLSDLPYMVKNINPKMTHGFTVGIVGNLRLAKHFDLRFIPSLSFGERSINYNIVQIEETVDPTTGEISSVTKDGSITSSTQSTFVEFPLHVKFKSKRNNNTAAYIIAGGNYKIDMASQKKYEGEDGRPMCLMINRHDIAAEIGAGFDFYTGYFKLGIEIKMSYGLFDIAKEHNYMYTNSFDNIRNKTFQLSFTFE